MAIKDDKKKLQNDRLSMTHLKSMVAAINGMNDGGLEAGIVLRRDGEPYLVIRINGSSYHVFREVQTKQAGFNCCSETEDWQSNSLWEENLWHLRLLPPTPTPAE